MTLQVPFESFAKSAKKMAGTNEAYLSTHVTGTLVTSANPATGAHVVAVSHASREETTRLLKEQGVETFEGVWAEDGQISLEVDPLASAYIGAVAYQTGEHVPGVWVDAYTEQPSHVQVLRAMYEEFRDTGESDDVTFEEFVRLSNPNVVVVSATQLRGFLEEKKSKDAK